MAQGARDGQMGELRAAAGAEQWQLSTKSAWSHMECWIFWDLLGNGGTCCSSTPV